MNTYTTTNILSSKNIKLDASDVITRIVVTNILGNTVIDLTQFEYINGSLEVRITNILGDTKIIASANVRVLMNNLSILGESTEKSMHYADCENTLYITGENILGDIYVV